MTEHSVSRRDFLAGSAAAAGALAAPATAAAPSRAALPQDGPHWLDGTPPATQEGQCWGYPWPRGTQRAHATFRMIGADGKAVPLQSWPMAWWPDGSLKWTGHAIPADTALTDGLRIEPGRPAAPAAPVTVTEQSGAIEVSSGPLRWRIARSGPAIILSARNGQREVLRDVRLVATAQDRPDEEDGPATDDPVADRVERGGPALLAVLLREELWREDHPTLVRVGDPQNPSWWLREPELSADGTLADRVEWATFSLLTTAGRLDEVSFLDRIYALFPGIASPDEELIRACLAAYAEVDLLLFDWLNLRGTFDYAGISNDQDKTRWAFGAEPFINHFIQPRLQYRINNGIPSRPQDNYDELIFELHFFL